MKRQLVLIAFGLLLFTPLLFSQGKWKVAVEYFGQDRLGDQFVYKVKNELNRSSFFSLVSPDEANLLVQIVTLGIDGEKGEREKAFACSITYLVQLPGDKRLYYCDQGLRLIGEKKIESIATSVSAQAFKQAQDFLGNEWKTK